MSRRKSVFVDVFDLAESELEEYADDKGLSGTDCLDEFVIELKLSEASAINNEGTLGQVQYLLGCLASGPDDLEKAVAEIKKAMDVEES